ncbi:2-hydroxychromene-2-carboxylate isomerase [Pseudoduganella plicata]|uniref:2-hydroxychromene-2-carboxylate isomerase n=1 Tax=Pseudoduganella plicata TaxID=321984 RepID=A0A4V1AU28_9BURK|nr:2-hydroxychromene-2-carboxylate isomerase [Pseudoduganella plicata]QBQ37718.1 2-hydroxychromene-2-carboxylate isomerase [Pseudoduganella plicata]GGY92574.1 2-hydroxychromene-2-carboxylate isomerase [Pseudoduganella plicata]
MDHQNSPIDFYFDPCSPYAYFAATGIEALAARHGRTVRWRPVSLLALFKASGTTPAPMVPLRGPYVIHDVARTAQLHGIPYRKPVNFPQLLLAAPRAMLWIEDAYGAAQTATFAKRCFSAYFVEGVDLAQDEEVVRLAQEQGVDGARLRIALQGTAIKEALKTAGEEAIARGVFGVPFMIVDDEPFWGFDRFDQLERWLEKAAATQAAA